MKKLLCVVVAICCLIALYGCSSSNNTGVYKYYSLTMTPSAAANETDDAFGILGGALGKSLIESLLEDTYIEIKTDKSISFYSPTGGVRESGPEELLGDSAEDMRYEFDGDLLHITSDGVILTYKKATAEELSIYNQLVKASKADQGESSDAEITLAESEGTPSPEDPSYSDEIPLGIYYATSMVNNGAEEDLLDGYLCLDENGSGYYYSHGETIDFNWSYENSNFTFTTKYLSKFVGTYNDGIIEGQSDDTHYVFDSNYTPPTMPTGEWIASAWIDPETGESIDLPIPDFSLRMIFNQGSTGIVYISIDGEDFEYSFTWSQRGNSVIAIDSDGDQFTGVYFNNYLYGEYLDAMLILEQ